MNGTERVEGAGRSDPPGSDGRRTGPVRSAAGAGIVAAAALAVACSSDQLPVDAELSMTPAERRVEIVEYRDAEGRCTFDPNRFVDLPVVMRLRAGDGSPIAGADVRVYVDFAANTFSGYPALALYEDRNGNGVVDADSELASGADDDIATVRTGDGGASVAMLLRVNVSCAYRGEVFAYVDGVSAQSSVEVSARDIVQPDPVVAPGDDPQEREGGEAAPSVEDAEPVPGAVPVPGTVDGTDGGADGGGTGDGADGAEDVDGPSDDGSEAIPNPLEPVPAGEPVAPEPEPLICFEERTATGPVVCRVDAEPAR